MSQHDGVANKAASVSILPQAATASVTGTGVDTKGARMSTMVFAASAFSGAGPGITVGLEESDDNVTFTTVADADQLPVSGSRVLAASGARMVGYRGTKRYIRGVATFASGTSATVSAVAILEGNPFEGTV
jgi:hypothetical protein